MFTRIPIQLLTDSNQLLQCKLYTTAEPVLFDILVQHNTVLLHKDDTLYIVATTNDTLFHLFHILDINIYSYWITSNPELHSIDGELFHRPISSLPVLTMNLFTRHIVQQTFLQYRNHLLARDLELSSDHIAVSVANFVFE